MESFDDWSYLQVHLWRSTSRKMTYPLFFCASFYMSGAVCMVMVIGFYLVMPNPVPVCNDNYYDDSDDNRVDGDGIG